MTKLYTPPFSQAIISAKKQRRARPWVSMGLICDAFKFQFLARIIVLQSILLGALLFVISGCTSTTYVSSIDPPVQALEKAVEERSEDALFVKNTLIPQEWWLLFGDVQLNAFIQKALENNPILQKAKMQILAAAYNAASVESVLYPYLSWGANVSRQKLSETGVIPFNSGPSSSGAPSTDVPVTAGRESRMSEYFSVYETEINLKYSFDFWGKNRNIFRAALGAVQANVAEEAFARLQLAFLVADVYYKLQMNYKREELAKSLLDNRQRYFELVQRRVRANIDNDLSLQNAESNLFDTQESLLLIQGDIEVNRYQLMAHMAGNFDEEIGPLAIAQKPLPRVPLPENLPLHLISRRPDITAQLWLIESAGRQIDVAKAGFYPDFNLSALFGFQAIRFTELFKWPSSYFNIAPAVSLPIFDGGRLIANLRASEINYDLAILTYNDLVLNAAKEVLESLAILRNTWERLKAFERKFDSQSELHRLTSLRVSHSLNTSLDALSSQANRLIAQDQTVVAQGKTIHAILELIRALGGGYDNCEE